MTKRKRDVNGEVVSDKVRDDEAGHSLEDKRPKVPVPDDKLQDIGESSLATDDNTQAEGSRPRDRGRLSRKSENSSDGEKRPELRSQKSLDGEDSASDKGSMMEETNSHLYQELLDVVLKMKDGSGRMICELFLTLPPRQQYPEYYKVIKDPVDLKMICSQVKNNAYSSLDDIEKDLHLLVKNAHAFNKPGSQVYKDATTIKRTVSAKRQEMEHTLSGAKSSKRLRSKRATSKMSLAIHTLLSDTDDDEDMQTDTSQLLDEEEYEKNNVSADLLEDDTDDPFMALCNSVRTYSDYSGRIVSEAFMRLPSKRTYPDYYEVIKNPIGLSRIGSNIKNGFYGSLDVLTAEMDRCFENAKAYNEMLYQDAVTLQDVLQSRKADIEKISLEKGIALTRPVKKLLPPKQAPPQPEPPSPNPVVASQPQQPGNPAYVGVVPSRTSHVLGSNQAVNINTNLLGGQFSNVMRLPTPGLAQTMMGLSTSYGNQAMPTMASQNSTNLQRPGGIVNGSVPVNSMNQFSQMPSMGTQQFANSMQQFSSAYQQQQHSAQDPQQVNQLPPPYPNLQGIQQSLQQQTHLTQPNQTAAMQPDQRQQTQQAMFPMQRPQFMESQSTEAQMTPLFHSPPPRQQKLLHSDVYLRYIEGLRDGTPHLSNWNPNKPDLNKMTLQQQAQLSAQWLGTAYNPHPSTVNTLWALREHAERCSETTQVHSKLLLDYGNYTN